ncbi:MAG: hemerythrin family protein [Desulfatibacillum sp.]|nr:hemerythrin family protein [Desulfatibacillum sp.]
MAFFQWDDKYSVGVARFDQEHKKLIDLTNRFYDAMKEGKGRDVIGPTCRELVNYTKTHFANEELALAKTSYPNLAEHKREHNLFTNQALDLQKKVESGEPVVISSIGNFLKNWLINHIQGTDKTYSKYFS